MECVMFRLDWESPNVLNRAMVYMALEAKFGHSSVRFKKNWHESRTYRKLSSAGLYPKRGHIKCALNVLAWNR